MSPNDPFLNVASRCRQIDCSAAGCQTFNSKASADTHIMLFRNPCLGLLIYAEAAIQQDICCVKSSNDSTAGWCDEV